MEKISHIVRSSARVATPDIKTDRATRPGAPTYGKPSEVEAPKKPASQEAMIQQSADSFFMSRPRVEKTTEQQSPAVVHEMDMAARESMHDAIEELNGPHAQEVESIQPSGFTPRGSFVNVHA